MRLRLLLFGFIVATVAPTAATAGQFHLAQRPNDDSYMAGLLTLALKAQGEDHSLEVSVLRFKTQSRALRSIADGTSVANVYYAGYSTEREDTLAMVRVPLTRGLLGYRVLGIRRENSGRLAGVRTLEDLAAMKIGSGQDWPDTIILRSGGLDVVTAGGANFWQLLDRGRFDLFPRGMNEISFELQRPDLANVMKNMTIDPHVMLAYRLDFFFFLSKENADLARIIEDGLKNAYADGSFMRYFNNYDAFAGVLAEQDRLKRKVLWLDNPDLSTTVRAIPAHYWHPLE